MGVRCRLTRGGDHSSCGVLFPHAATFTAMSQPACSCRLAWSIAVLALAAGGALAVWPSAGVPAPAPAPMPAPSETVVQLRSELEETRRVLDHVQSAVAQRDREIAAAEDELRNLRREVETLRARPAQTP